ncbi:cell envelope biogenesis protein TolA [Myxococcus sp. K15C18031901]|uniref:cell envelope biogenesis protein TolA n=1 Tax=Myxococcus dinghuensis TaxID=2906761 RepID=UPI0020A81B93|nr:cell envelope biogenesis protein TolA [Myxococcus dinghuensis]MCP3100074.1 cell envelope biogenesis protein TolA [Myxococcus dinghuensis]
MSFLVIALAVGLAISLYFNLFGGAKQAALPASTSSHHAPRADTEADQKAARAKAEAELQRKQKELDEVRGQFQEVKEQLKQTKRKVFEQKESDKGSQDLAKARAEVERNASIQLEQTRQELAAVLTENQRLKAESESRGRRREQTPAPAAAVAAPAAAPAPQIAAPAKEGESVVAAAVPVAPAAEASREEKNVRRFRELNDADREKMERLEQAANKDRARAVDLEKEVRRVKGREQTQQRVYAATKGDLDLMKDKFKALEKRLNRTLLERDLLRRAIKDLEKKTGILADRTELTPEEMAASDQRTEETARVRAESETQAAAQQPAEAPTATEAQAAESEAKAAPQA